eukprot:12081476-Alexandrium_andersonii.AAC.1
MGMKSKECYDEVEVGNEPNLINMFEGGGAAADTADIMSAVRLSYKDGGDTKTNQDIMKAMTEAMHY